MEIRQIDHFTICCTPDELPRLRHFYGEVLGMPEGARPDFSFPGHWLYAGGKPIVHLAALASADTPAMQKGLRGFDHVAMRISGIDTTRAHFKRLGVPYQEAPVPGFPLHQLFLRDPAGIKIELTFDLAELAADDPAREMTGDAAIITI